MLSALHVPCCIAGGEAEPRHIACGRGWKRQEQLRLPVSLTLCLCRTSRRGCYHYDRDDFGEENALNDDGDRDRRAELQRRQLFVMKMRYDEERSTECADAE